MQNAFFIMKLLCFSLFSYSTQLNSVNMDGSCIQIVCSCVWLAYQNGITPTAADYILLVFCATFGSVSRELSLLLLVHLMT